MTPQPNTSSHSPLYNTCNSTSLIKTYSTVKRFWFESHGPRLALKFLYQDFLALTIESYDQIFIGYTFSFSFSFHFHIHDQDCDSHHFNADPDPCPLSSCSLERRSGSGADFSISFGFLLIEVMRIGELLSADPPGLIFKHLKFLNFAFHADSDPDPAFHSNAIHADPETCPNLFLVH
jgi:hypothetical protein